MKKFKKGNRVCHKSGTGSAMAVKGYSELTGEVICKWFDRDKKEWKEGLFEEEELVLAERRALSREGCKNIGQFK